MKSLRYSLVALLALGTLSYVNAETQPTDSTDTEKSADVTDKSIPPSTKTSIMDALKGTTIGGYVYSQYTGMFGSDADGQALRFRTRIDVNTGSYYGFSVGTSVYASVGGGSPDGGTFLQNSTNKQDYRPAEDLPITLKTLYGRQTFESSATVITAGKINLVTPFTDTAFDAGYGATIDNYDVKGVGFHLQAYGLWELDNKRMKPDSASQTGYDKSRTISEKGLFIAGISGDSKELAGVGFEFWGAHAPEVIDFLAFADLNYTIAGVTLQTQIATTQVKQTGLLNSFALKKEKTAKLRGLYNFQLAYKHAESGVSASAGYTGSFGDGYGALLNNTSSFNMGGKLWYDVVGDGLNGYGIGGAGSFKLTDGSNADGSNKYKSSTIQVAYLSLAYKGVKNLSLGLDYAFVETNSYAVMTKTYNKKVSSGSFTPEKYYDFHEVSLTVNYAFNDKLSMSVLGGSTFGDLQMGRARVKVNYSF